jgi:ANTAR domain-containing protein
MLRDKGRDDGVGLMDGVDALPAGPDRIAQLEAEVAQLREAMAHRQQYGVVTGVLAVRFGIPPERAWQFLVRLSQESNLKVQIIARVLHDRFFGEVAAEDEAIAAQLDAQLCGQLGPLVSAAVVGKDAHERG